MENHRFYLSSHNVKQYFYKKNVKEALRMRIITNNYNCNETLNHILKAFFVHIILLTEKIHQNVIS